MTIAATHAAADNNNIMSIAIFTAYLMQPLLLFP